MRGLPVPSSPSALADWIEIQLLLGEERRLSTAELVDRVAEEGGVADLAAFDLIDSVGAEDLDDEVSGDGQDLEDLRGSEVLVLDALGILEARGGTVGALYPIGADDTGAEVRDVNHVYRFLCALVARRLLSSREGIHKGARLFEVLTAVAARNYLGGEARAIGFPRRDGSGFRDCIQKLVREMRDQISVAPADIPGEIKDLGVDVVAWRPLDGAPGNATILVQCATGGDWNGKGVQPGPWGKIVKHAVSPLTAIAFPFIPDFEPSGLDWELMCGAGGIPLHRLRLTALVPPGDVPPDVLEEMAAWSDAVARLVFAELPEGEIDSDVMIAADEAEALGYDPLLPAFSVTV